MLAVEFYVEVHIHCADLCERPRPLGGYLVEHLRGRHQVSDRYGQWVGSDVGARRFSALLHYHNLQNDLGALERPIVSAVDAEEHDVALKVRIPSFTLSFLSLPYLFDLEHLRQFHPHTVFGKPTALP